MDKDMELKLNMLATIQKTYAMLYQEIGVCGIGNDYVQMTADAFRAAFPDAVEEKPYTDKFNILETEHNGVKFIALTYKESTDV